MAGSITRNTSNHADREVHSRAIPRFAPNMPRHGAVTVVQAIDLQHLIPAEVLGNLFQAAPNQGFGALHAGLPTKLSTVAVDSRGAVTALGTALAPRRLRPS